MRLCDAGNRPSLCTTCGNTGNDDTRFVDTEAVREGPAVLDKETGQIAVDPRGAQVILEDVYICDGCGQTIADLFAYIPGLHRRHLEEIRRMRAELEHAEGEIRLLRQLKGLEVAA